MRYAKSIDRRRFIATAGMISAGGFLVKCANVGTGRVAAEEMEKEREVTPAEDLMFEHGAIERMLLIYDRLCTRIDSGAQVSAHLIFTTADLMRNFGAQYHEKLEEQYIFPRLEKAQKHVSLIKTLRRQHIVAREITAVLLEATEVATLQNPPEIAQAMRSFNEMYLPHIARENSVVFRTFHDLVPPAEYAELGEEFEDKEHELFGRDGFGKIIAQIGDIEKQLGLDDLEQLMPDVEAL